MSRCWAALAPPAVGQRRGAGRGWRARRAGPLTPLEARGRIGFGACRRLGQKWSPVLRGGAPRRGPALWRISGHRPTPVPACVSVGIRVCLCVSALPARKLLRTCAPVFLCTYILCLCVLATFPGSECLCAARTSVDPLVLLCHVFCTSLCVSSCLCHSEDVYAFVCASGPCSVSGRFFSKSVSPSYLCVSVCPRAPELFCVAQGFLCLWLCVLCISRRLCVSVSGSTGMWMQSFLHPPFVRLSLPSVGNLKP